MRTTQDFHFHIANKASSTSDARHDCEEEREETVSCSSRTLAELQIDDADKFIAVFGNNLIDTVKQLISLLRNIEQSCVKRNMNIFEMPFFPSTFIGMFSKTNGSVDQSECLNRNLSSFGLET